MTAVPAVALLRNGGEVTALLDVDSGHFAYNDRGRARALTPHQYIEAKETER